MSHHNLKAVVVLFLLFGMAGMSMAVQGSQEEVKEGCHSGLLLPAAFLADM